MCGSYPSPHRISPLASITFSMSGASLISLVGLFFQETVLCPCSPSRAGADMQAGEGIIGARLNVSSPLWEGFTTALPGSQ